LSGRFAIYINQSDGHQANQGTLGSEGTTLAPGTIPAVALVNPDSDWAGANKLALRGALQWVGEGVDVLFNLHYLEDHSETWQRKLHGTDVRGFTDPSDDPHDIVTNLEAETDLHSWGGLLKANWTLAHLNLTSVTGFEFLRSFFVTDDSSPTRLIEQNFSNGSYAISQELRISSYHQDPFTWQAGLYLSRDEVRHNKVAVVLDSAATNVDGNFRRLAQGWATFAHIEYALSEQFKLIGGLRYLQDFRDFEASYSDLDPFGLSPKPFDLPIFVDDHFNSSDVVWNTGINWTPTDNTLLYASASKGFKSGGYDGSIILNTGAAEPFDEETLNTYELGLKTTLNKLQINSAIFFYDYQNLQAETTVFINTGVGVIPDNRIKNAGEAEVWGGEIELIWQPVKRLTLNGTLSLLDTEITSFNSDDPSEQFSGNQLPDAPELSYRTALRYERPVLNNNQFITLQTDYSYTSKTYRDINNSSEIESGSVGLLNASVALSDSNRRWAVGVWIKNIVDEKYTTSNYFGGFGGVTQLFGLPRTYGIDLHYQF